MINLRRVAWKVQMRSGKLTRHKWVQNRVFLRDIVRDSDGRIFRVMEVKMVPDPSMELTKLERITDVSKLGRLAKKATLQNAHDNRIRDASEG